jgi:hypothetical protein
MARIFERWLGNSAQSDKWKFCLSAARIPRVGRAHDEADPPQPQPGLQGEGKAKVALSAVNGEKTLAELARLLETTASNIFTAPSATLRRRARLSAGIKP